MRVLQAIAVGLGLCGGCAVGIPLPDTHEEVDNHVDVFDSEHMAEQIMGTLKFGNSEVKAATVARFLEMKNALGLMDKNTIFEKEKERMMGLNNDEFEAEISAMGNPFNKIPARKVIEKQIEDHRRKEINKLGSNKEAAAAKEAGKFLNVDKRKLDAVLDLDAWDTDIANTVMEHEKRIVKNRLREQERYERNKKKTMHSYMDDPEDLAVALEALDAEHKEAISRLAKQQAHIDTMRRKIYDDSEVDRQWKRDAEISGLKNEKLKKERREEIKGRHEAPHRHVPQPGSVEQLKAFAAAAKLDDVVVPHVEDVVTNEETLRKLTHVLQTSSVDAWKIFEFLDKDGDHKLNVIEAEALFLGEAMALHPGHAADSPAVQEEMRSARDFLFHNQKGDRDEDMLLSFGELVDLMEGMQEAAADAEWEAHADSADLDFDTIKEREMELLSKFGENDDDDDEDEDVMW